MDMCKNLNGIQDLLELNPKIPISDCLLFAKGKHLLEKEQTKTRSQQQQQEEDEETTPFNGFLWPQYMEQYRGLEFYHFIKSWFRDYCNTSNAAAAAGQDDDQEEEECATLVGNNASSLSPSSLLQKENTQNNQSVSEAMNKEAVVGKDVSTNNKNISEGEKKIINSSNDGGVKRHDGQQKRMKALLLYGPRCIGRTSFATSLVNHNPKHFILCKNTFNQESFKPAMMGDGGEP